MSELWEEISEIDWELNPQGVLQTLKDKGLEPIDPH